MADEEASPEAKLKIARYFIMSSPTGEVNDVVKDVTKLVNDPKALSEDNVSKILVQYNQEQLVFAPDPTTNALVMVSAHGAVNATTYLDPNSGRHLKFDHKQGKFTESVDKKAEAPPAVRGFRNAIAKALDGYLDGNYKAGKVCAAVYGKEDAAIVVAISAKNIHLGNFWTGAWRAVYEVNVGKAGLSEVKGSIKTNVHYFEDGNVQLHTSVDKSASVNVAGEPDTATALVAAIGKMETDFQAELEGMYVKMHSTTFKAMRRFYPVTHQGMVWNVNAHNLASQVQSGAK